MHARWSSIVPAFAKAPLGIGQISAIVSLTAMEPPGSGRVSGCSPGAALLRTQQVHS